MPRKSQIDEKRQELLPVVAKAFTELGYRRATTAEIAKRCEVRENILYRLWPDKKAMFLATIDFVYDFAERTWNKVVESAAPSKSPAMTLLEFESRHHGEFGHYRIIFTGLAESDDPDIQKALGQMFARFHRFLLSQIVRHRKSKSRRDGLADELTSWAIVGLGTVVNIGRELNLLSAKQRGALLGEVSRTLLEA